MCNERELTDEMKRAASKLRTSRDTLDAATWEKRVAAQIERFGLGGGPLQDFCDLAGVP